MVAAADSCRGDRVGSISFDRVALSLHPARILWAKATGCRCCFSWRRWGNCGRPCLRGRRRADPPALRRRLLFFFEEVLFFFYARLDEWRWFDWKWLRVKISVLRTYFSKIETFETFIEIDPEKNGSDGCAGASTFDRKGECCWWGQVMVGPGATIGRSSGSGPLLEPAVISYGIYPPDDAAPSQGFFFSILIVAQFQFQFIR